MNKESGESWDNGVSRRSFIRNSAGAFVAASYLTAVRSDDKAFAAIEQGRDSNTVSPEIIPAGERWLVRSQILGEDRTVFVSIPASYSRSAQNYPVLYLTDAQWNFDHTRSSVRLLARNMIIPEMIIVGVTNVDRTRDLYSTKADFKHRDRTIRFPNSGNGDHFLDFFERELLPWTESKYRTLPLRILAGQSAGGNFAFHAMRVRPALFQAIIAASPWLTWDDSKELKLVEPFLESANVKSRALFFSSADEGAEMTSAIEGISRALRARKNSLLRWDYASYPNETHDSVVLKSYYDALRMIFIGWAFPRDPQTNLLKGSLADVKAHYEQLGQSLGCKMIPPEALVNELGYQLLNAKQFEAALVSLRYNSELYPQSATVWDRLGEAFEAAGKKEEALTSYRKAVSIAEMNGHPSLENFRQKVARLSRSL